MVESIGVAPILQRAVDKPTELAIYNDANTAWIAAQTELENQMVAAFTAGNLEAVDRVCNQTAGVCTSEQQKRWMVLRSILHGSRQLEAMVAAGIDTYHLGDDTANVLDAVYTAHTTLDGMSSAISQFTHS